MDKSFWGQTYSQVRANPYEYKMRQRFLNEARVVLDEIFKEYDKYQLKFSLEDQSDSKAIWMLHLDALDTLRDCIILLEQKKHRIVGKLFRDIIETLDLAKLFWWEKDSGSINLKKWYKDETIPHSNYRECLKSIKKKEWETYHNDNSNKGDIVGEQFRKESSEIYSALSKWTHHCYFTLKNSYSLAGNNGKMLVYDGHSELLILDQTISGYAWELKDTILYFLCEVKLIKLVDWDELKVFLNKTIKGFKFN